MKLHNLFLRVLLLAGISGILCNLAFGSSGITIDYDSTTRNNRIYSVDFITGVASSPVAVSFNGSGWSSLAIDVDADRFYIITSDQSIYTFDLATRLPLKQAKLLPSIPRISEIVTVKSGVVMGLRSDNGEIYDIYPSSGLNEPFASSGSNNIVRNTFTSDIARGKFYVITDYNMLHIFDSLTGDKTVKQLDIGSATVYFLSVTLVANGNLVARASDGNFYIIDPSSGTSQILNTTA